MGDWAKRKTSVNQPKSSRLIWYLLLVSRSCDVCIRIILFLIYFIYRSSLRNNRIPLWEDTAYAVVPLVIYGVFGNYNYHHFATQKVKKMMANQCTREEFVKAGGFKWRRFFAFAALLVAYLGISTILFY